MNIFQLLAPATYWLLIVLWAYIFFFHIKRFRLRRGENQLLITLIIVLAIDAFRTLFESIYFGAWYTSLAGLMPIAIHDFLVRPEIVMIPKLINLVAASTVIIILLRRWFPAEENERHQQEKHMREMAETIAGLKDTKELVRRSRDEFEMRLMEKTAELKNEILVRQEMESELKAAVVELATGEDGLHPDAINNTKPITRQTVVFLTIIASLRRIQIANWLYLCSTDEEI